MANITLKALLNRKSGAYAAVTGWLQATGNAAGIEDLTGNLLVGTVAAEHHRLPIEHEGLALGWVSAASLETATALAALLAHLAAKEAERRALASEVLFLYREVHLIERLSEQLAALPELSDIGQFALAICFSPPFFKSDRYNS